MSSASLGFDLLLSDSELDASHPVTLQHRKARSRLFFIISKNELFLFLSSLRLRVRFVFMQIRIDVVAIKGAGSPRALSAVFDANGGTIGRAESNKLVLDDPDRTVSRVHAQIVCRSGTFFIVDRGSNAVQWNGQLLGAGNEAKLEAGDKLFVGSFELSVGVHAPAGQTTSAGNAALNASSNLASDPFSDPFADLLDGFELPSASVGPLSSKAAPSSASTQSSAQPTSALASDPFADLLDPMAQPAAQAPYMPANQLLGKDGPMADLSDLGLGPSSAGKSLDALFGLDNSRPSADPFAFSPLADPLMQPNTSGDNDPLRALVTPPAKPTPAPRSDHVPALHHAYVPPPTRTEFVPVDPNTTISKMPHPKTEKPLDKLNLNVSSGAPNSQELLEALLKGLQMTHQAPQQLTPELMERIGSILRTVSEGTLQLLLTRQDFKRELRADVTMIASNHNNPLKFSPTTEVALAHLLGEQVRGFMAPKDAMRDAFNDLKAHQLGVMVGMKAALTQLLDRFTPESLEEKIAAKSKFDGLFAANRKAKLWDQFCTLQKSISREAEDDFHSLFGKEFAKTYDEQMALLRHPGAKSGS